MDSVLRPSIVTDIYNYLSWDTLKFYTLEDRFWKSQINHLFPKRKQWWSSPNIYYLNPDRQKSSNGPKYFSLFLWAIHGYLCFCKYRCGDIPKTLLNNEGFMKLAIQINPYCISYSEKFRNSYEIVFDVVTKSGELLSYASDTMKNNRDIVIRAITQHPPSIQYASPSLKADIDIALLAIRRNGDLVQYISPNLYSNKDIILETFKADGGWWIIDHIPDNLWHDQKIIIAALNAGCCCYMLNHVPDFLLIERDIIISAIKGNKNLLQLTDCTKEKMDILSGFQNNFRIFQQKRNAIEYNHDGFIKSCLKYICQSFYAPVIPLLSHSMLDHLQSITERNNQILYSASIINGQITRWTYNYYYLHTLSNDNITNRNCRKKILLIQNI